MKVAAAIVAPGVAPVLAIVAAVFSQLPPVLAQFATILAGLPPIAPTHVALHLTPALMHFAHPLPDFPPVVPRFGPRWRIGVDNGGHRGRRHQNRSEARRGGTWWVSTCKSRW